MSDSQLDNEKRLLRAAMRVRLASADPAAASSATRAVVESEAFRDAERIGLYASIQEELPTRSLFAAVVAAGKVALFPRCVGETLEFAEVESWEALVGGAFGTREPPAACPPETFAPRDLVLLPGLAFDLHGGRLGRGRGYYDRAFAAGAVPILCGLAYAAQIVERVPMGQYDVQMNAIATENGWSLSMTATSKETGGA
jgi:5-formyltetrahydrofolate cyclo-ligase